MNKELKEAIDVISRFIEENDKPEPREFTVCLCKRYQPFKIQEMRCNNCEGYGNCEIIKVREVLDDE